MAKYIQNITFQRIVEDEEGSLAAPLTKGAVLLDLMKRAGTLTFMDFEVSNVDVYKLKLDKDGNERRDYDYD